MSTHISICIVIKFYRILNFGLFELFVPISTSPPHARLIRVRDLPPSQDEK